MTSRRLCVITPRIDGPTETFIRAHIDRLPAEVRVLYGGFFPRFEKDGPALLPGSHRAAAGLVARVSGADRRRVEASLIARMSRDGRTRALAGRLSGIAPLAVLAEYGQTGAAVTEACTRAGVPLVVHFHGYDAYAAHVLEEHGPAYPAMFAAAAALVAVSGDMRRQLIELGAPEERVRLAPYGIDLERFAPRESRGIDPTFVAVGRFVDKKAPHLTVLAFREVVREVPEARLRMIGTGPLLDACVQLARALGIDQAIEFEGRASHERVTDVMAEARAVVQHSLRPTHGDSEGTPLAILEAGASGVPVVATRHGGIIDAVKDGETGFLVDERDVGAMSERMIRLARDRDLALRMGDSARNRIAEHYSMDLHIERLWGILCAAAEA